MTTTTELVPLTDRQRQILDWIFTYTSERGFPPTVREGQAAFLFDSPNGFVCHLQALERKGWVTRNPRSPRTLRLTEAASNVH